MKSPVNKIILVITSIMVLSGSLFLYFKLKPEPPKSEIVSASTGTKKKKTKRVVPQKDLPPIIEEIEEDEKLDSFVKGSLSKPKDHILGLTINYDEKINYNITAGKRISQDCYAIGKASTDLKLSSIEAGVLCLF